MSTTSTGQRLKDVEARVRDARDELAQAKRAVEDTKTALVRAADSGRGGRIEDLSEYKTAERARARLRAVEEQLEAARDERVAVLSEIGSGRSSSFGGNGPRSGDYTGDGWALAAREFDLGSGRDRIEVPVSDLMRPPAFATVTPTPGSGLTRPAFDVPGVVPLPRDVRALYPALRREQLEDRTLALTEWQQTGERKVTNSVERDPAATTEKAQLDLTVKLETPTVKQFAVVIDKIPSKLLTSVDAFEQFLQEEARYALDRALDEHVVSAIEAAEPAHGNTGATMMEQTRNAVAAMREVGANPTVLAVTSKEAAELDVLKTELGYVFASRAAGSASPLWGMEIREVPDIKVPTLIDPALLGVLWVAMGTLILDPYSGLKTNEVALRIEFDALYHVRDKTGAYEVKE